MRLLPTRSPSVLSRARRIRERSCGHCRRWTRKLGPGREGRTLVVAEVTGIAAAHSRPRPRRLSLHAIFCLLGVFQTCGRTVSIRDHGRGVDGVSQLTRRRRPIRRDPGGRALRRRGPVVARGGRSGRAGDADAAPRRGVFTPLLVGPTRRALGDHAHAEKRLRESTLLQVVPKDQRASRRPRCLSTSVLPTTPICLEDDGGDGLRTPPGARGGAGQLI